MKNIFFGILAIALVSTAAIAYDGGKKKNGQQAQTECNKAKNCEDKCCKQKCGTPGTCQKKEGKADATKDEQRPATASPKSGK